MSRFQNVLPGGLAVFALRNVSSSSCIVEGKIRQGRRTHFSLDFYEAEGVSVLSEWRGAPRVRKNYKS